MEQPNYFAVIPAEVRYNTDLTANAKLLYGEITALADKEGKCNAGNKYFAQLYNVSTVSISKWVSQLAKAGYLTIEFIYKKDSKEIEQRVLNISLIPHKENFNTPLKKSLKSIYINNTIHTDSTNSSIYNNNIYTNNINTKTTNNPHKNKTVHFSPEVEKAFDYFLELFEGEKTLPKTKPQKNKWKKSLEFIEKHYNLGDVYRAIRWARKDDFWAANVLSLPPMIVSKNGERKLDKILAKYNSLHNDNKPEPMTRIKGEWKLIQTAEGKTEVQVKNQYGKIINEFLLTQHNGFNKTEIQQIKNYLNGKPN